MARVKGTAGFGEASDFEAVSFEFDADEAQPEYIPAVTREVDVLDDEGNPVYEDGIKRTTTEVVSPGRMETLDEAVRKALIDYLVVDEVERSGLTNIRATISFTVTGTLEFDAQDWGIDLEDYEVDPDDVDSYFVSDNFGDTIEEAIREAARSSWESESEFEVDIDEVE